MPAHRDVIKVWDLESGREIATLQGHTEDVQACAVTPDGRCVVSASWDRTLRVWDIESGRGVATFEGHTDIVWGCTIAASWECIVSWSDDRTLKVWDLATARCLATIHSPCIFRSVAIAGNLLCAIDRVDNLWVLETPWSTPRRIAATAAKLFYSYSPEDEALRDELETHLALLERRGLIEAWHHRNIGAGEEAARVVDEHLERADVILLLISADFIASDYCFDREMKRALERHDKNEAVVVPVLLRPCDWHGAPFAALLAAGAKPVTAWTDHDEAWTDVVTKLRALIAGLPARR